MYIDTHHSTCTGGLEPRGLRKPELGRGDRARVGESGARGEGGQRFSSHRTARWEGGARQGLHTHPPRTS